MHLEFRQGTPSDTEALLDLLTRAYKREPGSAAWLLWERSLPNEADRYRLLMADGRLAGAARISRDSVRVGQCVITKGDVGHVGVDPEMQGRGLGTALMKHCVEWMRQNDFDISRLGGLTRFYSRFGWEPFPRRYVELPIETVGAGADRLTPDQYLKLPAELAERVRAYNPATDSGARAYVQWKFNENRTGAPAFNRPESDGRVKKGVARLACKPCSREHWLQATSGTPPHNLQFVYEREGVIYGYLFARQFPKDHSDFEAQITVEDVAFDGAEGATVEALLKHIMIVGFQRGAARVTARLPFDPLLCAIMSGAGITHKLVELQGGVASNMIQVINLKSLFRKISPELSDRLRRSSAPEVQGILEVSAKEQTAQLLIHNQDIVCVEGQQPDARISTDHATLLKMVLGLQPFGELPIQEATGLAPAWSALLSVLFPRQPTYSGNWG
jgi:predicted N-acetyltransferase YhbS